MRRLHFYLCNGPSSFLWSMCTSYTEEHTQHTRGMGGAFMQTVEWEESKKRVIDTGKVEKERAGLNRARSGSSFRWCWYLWIWARRKQLVGVVCWGLSELRVGLGVRNGDWAVKGVCLRGARRLLWVRTH